MLRKFDFVFFGGIFKIFEKQKTKNGIEYIPIRVCSYKNEGNNFILFENKVDINSVQVGQGTKIIGTITIDDETRNHRVIVEQLNILNKTIIDEKKLPSIDEEHDELGQQGIQNIKYTK